MKNYIIHEDELTRFCDNNIKIFSGTPEIVEAELMAFINSKPMEIDHILQSESHGPINSGHGRLTITLFYSTANGVPRFIDKNLTAKAISDVVFDYIEDVVGVPYDDIVELIVNRYIKIDENRK